MNQPEEKIIWKHVIKGLIEALDKPDCKKIIKKLKDSILSNEEFLKLISSNNNFISKFLKASSEIAKIENKNEMDVLNGAIFFIFDILILSKSEINKFHNIEKYYDSVGDWYTISLDDMELQEALELEEYLGLDYDKESVLDYEEEGEREVWITFLYAHSNIDKYIIELLDFKTSPRIFLEKKKFRNFMKRYEIKDIDILTEYRDKISIVHENKRYFCEYDEDNGIVSLDLRKKHISTMKNLGHLTILQELFLGDNGIVSIEGLEYLTDLQLLDLNSNKIKIIEGLDKLLNLKELNLALNNIENIEGLDSLSNLKELNLNSNKIGKIKGMERLLNLESLVINRNLIKRIEGLDNLKNLSYLSIDDNQIKKIEGLKELKNLTHLNIRKNQISKIEGLEQNTKLVQLFLDRNQIHRIEGLQNLTELKFLFLYSNQIKRIEGIGNLHNLVDLNLNVNQIQRIECIEILKNLKTLMELKLDNNPLLPDEQEIYKTGHWHRWA